MITNERYDNITEVCDACVRKSPKTMTTTQKIDRVVTNRILGIPIFIVIMFLVLLSRCATVGTHRDRLGQQRTACSATAGSTPAPNGTRLRRRGVRGHPSRPTRGRGCLRSRRVGGARSGADYGFYHVGVPVVAGGWLESTVRAPLGAVARAGRHHRRRGRRHRLHPAADRAVHPARLLGGLRTAW
ncbi:MAG: hypothetical protein ACLTDR_04875 [Adlercreutzia equolifaciens]